MVPRDIIDKIRRIELRTARAVDTRLAGSYKSVFKGRGVTFSEVRKYQPGDDVAAIDWYVSARMNEPHIKLFTEERDHTVLIVFDGSGSGLFGSRARHKRDVAAEVAAILAFAANANNDRVGLVLHTDEVEHVVPPKKGRRHALRVIHDILRHTPRSPRTDVAAALTYIRKLAKRRALVFLISDFLAFDWEKPLQIASKRHDIVPIVVTDPMEKSLLDLGFVTFEDLETGELVEFDTSGPAAREYRRAMMSMQCERERIFRRHGIDTIDVRTDRPCLHALLRFFRARARRMAST